MYEPPELHIKILGLSVSAKGALAIGAALLVFFGFLAISHFWLTHV